MSNLFSLPFAQTAMGTLGAMLVTLGLKTLRGPTEHPSSPPQKPLADVHQQSVTPPEYAWKWGVLSGKCPQRELSERPASLGRSPGPRGSGLGAGLWEESRTPSPPRSLPRGHWEEQRSLIIVGLCSCLFRRRNSRY